MPHPLGPAQPRTPEVQCLFDASAVAYSEDRDRSASFLAQRRFALASLAGKFDRILEIGCGAGHMLSDLASRASTVVAVDLSSRMLHAAHDRLPGNASLAQADALHLPFRDSAFDAVLCMGVLEYVRADELLREIARVTRPAGLAVFTAPHAGCKARVFGAHLRRLARTLFRRHSTDLVMARHTADRLRHMIDVMGFVPGPAAYCGVRVIPWPVDELFPHTTSRVNDTLERWRPIAGHAWFASVSCLVARRRPRPLDNPPTES